MIRKCCIQPLAIAMAVQASLLAPGLAIAQSTVTIPLHLDGGPATAKSRSDSVRDLAVALVISSSLNTAAQPEMLKQSVPEIQARYRQVVSGNCLVLSYDTPVTIETMAGDVTVSEIVIGLGRPDYADAVFTIDAEGRVVAHEKYSGYIAAELRAAADEAVGAR